MKKTNKSLKSSEVAKLLDMGPDDVTLLARKGLIKGFKKGNQWRFNFSDIKAKTREFKSNEM